MKKIIKILLIYILISGCEKSENHTYVLNSLPYSLRLENNIDNHLLENSVNSFYSDFDSSNNTFNNIFLTNCYEALFEEKPCSILRYLDTSFCGFEQITFRQTKYPDLQFVYLIPFTKDLNSDGTNEIILMLTYKDSIVVSTYDRMKITDNPWLYNIKFEREDYHYLNFISFWNYQNQQHAIFQKGNRSRSVNNKIDTLAIINLETGNLVAYEPLGIPINEFNLDNIGNDSLIVNYSVDYHNNVKLGNLDDYYNYIFGTNIKGEIVWMDTLSGPENYSFPNEQIVYFTKEYTARSKLISGKRIFTKYNNISGEIVFQKEITSEMENIWKSPRIETDYVYGIRNSNEFVKMDESLKILNANKLSISGIKSINATCYNDGAHTFLPKGLLGSISYDINNNGENDHILETTDNQLICVDGESLKPLFASVPKKRYNSFGYIQMKDKNYLALQFSDKLNYYSIEKTPIMSKIFVWYKEIIYFNLLLLLPLIYYLNKKIYFYKVLFSKLGAKNSFYGIAVINKNRKIIYKNAKFSNFFLLEKNNLPHILIKQNDMNRNNANFEKVIKYNDSFLEINISEFSKHKQIILIRNITNLLKEKQRNEELTMAGSVIHGLKTQVSTIISDYQTINRLILNYEPGKIINVVFKRFSKKLSEITNTIKQISYIVKGMSNDSPIKTDIVKYLDNWIDNNYYRYYEYDIVFDKKYNCNNCYVNLYQKYFELLLISACDNALQAMNSEQERKTILFGIEILGEQIKLSITDNGIGMDAETIEKVKKIYGYSTKQTGSGFGIHLIDKVCREHNAKWNIESKVNSYTKLEILLNMEEIK